MRAKIYFFGVLENGNEFSCSTSKEYSTDDTSYEDLCDSTDRLVSYLRNAVSESYAKGLNAQLTIGNTIINVSRFAAIEISGGVLR